MKYFDHFTPTEIIFGVDRVTEVGVLAARYGKKAVLVTVPEFPAVAEPYVRARGSLADAGVVCVYYDGMIPSPTTELVTGGAKLAKAEGVDVVVGLGDDSFMGTAKAIAVKAAHPGTAWDYNCHTVGPTEQTLPTLAISTTAGTGNQTTPYAVVTKISAKNKSAIWDKNIFLCAAVADSEVTPSLPASVAVQTGFDTFYHNFETYPSVNTNPLMERMALNAIRIIATYLSRALADGSDLKTCSQMVWADTLGGLTDVSAGIILSHGLGMRIGGHCPHATRGQPLVVSCPVFTRYTYPTAEHKLATADRIFEPSPERGSDAMTAEKGRDVIDYFLKRIGPWTNFRELNVVREDIREIADCGWVLGNYASSPRAATIPEVYELLVSCYDRK